MNRTDGPAYSEDTGRHEMPEPTDAELMERFVGGDEAAFRQLVDRYRSPLVSFLFRLVWDKDHAEDMAQEVFCRLFVHKDQYAPQPGASVKTYLYRIARNLAIDQARRDGRRPHVLSLDREKPGDEPSTFAEAVPDPCRTPQTATSRSELAAAIQRAIDRLPEEQRVVFDLSEAQGLRYQEIATVLDIPVGTVKSRMHLAVKKLQALLARVRRSED